MKQIILPVTVHLNIRLPLALLQPEPADAPTGPEPEAHACQGCGNCGGCRKCQHEEKLPVLLGDLSFGDMKGFIDSSTKSFSPKHSETEELYTYFSHRSYGDYNELDAKKQYYDFLHTSVGIINDLSMELNDKEEEILLEISQSPNAYAIYSDLMNVIQINCNNKKLCDGLDTIEKLEYKSAMEHLLDLGLVERKKKRHILNFIYLTSKGAHYVENKQNKL